MLEFSFPELIWRRRLKARRKLVCRASVRVLASERLRTRVTEVREKQKGGRMTAALFCI